MTEDTGKLIAVQYRGTAGALITTGQILPAAAREIPFGAREANFCGVKVKLRWHFHDVSSMLAPDKISADQIVALLQPRGGKEK